MLNLLRPLTGLLLKSDKRERFLELPAILIWLTNATNKKYQTDRLNAVGYGFEYKKRKLLRLLRPDMNWYFLPFGHPGKTYENLINELQPDEFWVWSFRDKGKNFARSLHTDCQIRRVEDGFVRSVGLGANGALPRSLCIDNLGLYFASNTSSDLEELLNSFHTHRTPDLMKRAFAAMTAFVQSGVTKYNIAGNKRSFFTPPPGKINILVLGQVEDDQSIVQNPCDISTNHDLLKRAIDDNPDANILYRYHPDVLSGKRIRGSDVEILLPDFTICSQEQSITNLLDQVDCVYTISSLAGFEALMRGVPTKIFGCPFYAGWGVSDDSVSFPNRKAKLTVLDIFAAAYLIYPVYFDPKTGCQQTFEETLAYFSDT